MPAIFAETVCRTFGLGQSGDGNRIGSGANVAWRLATSTGDYVVKELPTQGRAALIEAAAFEYAVWTAQVVPMPEARPDRAGAFVDGYRAAGRPFPPVRAGDWEKWTAALGSWFEFKARCSLGDWSAIADEPRAEALLAVEALDGLDTTLRRIPDWTIAVNTAISGIGSPPRRRPG